MYTQGISILKKTIQNVPSSPGIYEMLGSNKKVLYVGKAKNLKNRLRSYTQIDKLSHRIKRMVSEIESVNFLCTKSEVEALLLESNMIAHLQPPYNVLLKDDKSYAFIKLSKDHDFPRLSKYRGPFSDKAKFFGPYPHGSDIDEIITTLQKLFKIRNCSDYDFASRKRPCIQYDIGRCTAPCVGKVSKEEYAAQVKQAKDFLEGKIDSILKTYQTKMQKCSEDLEFEKAAQFRDKIKVIQKLKQKQSVSLSTVENADILVVYQDENQTCIEQSIIRFHKQLGSQSFYFERDIEKETALYQFILQFYKRNIPAPELILSDEPEDKDLLLDYIESQHGIKVKFTIPQKGVKKDLVEFTLAQAKNAAIRQVKKEINLEEILGKTFNRIEVYDNSHLQGEFPYGVMIVATPKGFDRSSYRKFHIQNKTNDDYAMMKAVVHRRLQHQEWPLPEMMLIDGGKGQIRIVQNLLCEMSSRFPVHEALHHGSGSNAEEEIGPGPRYDSAGETNLRNIIVIGIAKGEGRKVDTLYRPDGSIIEPSEDLKYFLQNIRDEAHRFAISTHRYKRHGQVWKSELDQIPGIGAKRKKLLLKHFGSVKDLSKADLNEIESIKGINQATAKTIWQYFQERH